MSSAEAVDALAPWARDLKSEDLLSPFCVMCVLKELNLSFSGIFCKIFLSSKFFKSLGNLKSFAKVKNQKVRSKGRNTFPKSQSFLKVELFSFFLPFFILGWAKVSLPLSHIFGKLLIKKFILFLNF